jgi:hypothetical protein
MTERTDDWRSIFTSLTDDGGCYEMVGTYHNSVNIYQLTSHLEELYLINAELRDRIRQLEKDNELLKSYAWEQ